MHHITTLHFFLGNDKSKFRGCSALIYFRLPCFYVNLTILQTVKSWYQNRYVDIVDMPWNHLISFNILFFLWKPGCAFRRYISISYLAYITVTFIQHKQTKSSSETIVTWENFTSYGMQPRNYGQETFCLWQKRCIPDIHCGQFENFFVTERCNYLLLEKLSFW